jgi:hypothetical protein
MLKRRTLTCPIGFPIPQETMKICIEVAHKREDENEDSEEYDFGDDEEDDDTIGCNG